VSRADIFRGSFLRDVGPIITLLDQLADLEEGAHPHPVLRPDREHGRPPSTRALASLKATCIVAADWLHNACGLSPAAADVRLERQFEALKISAKTLKEWKRPNIRKKYRDEIEVLALTLRCIAYDYDRKLRNDSAPRAVMYDPLFKAGDQDRAINAILDHFFQSRD